MRRSLVLTDEAARHPFRAGLPPHVTRVDGPPDPAGWRISRTDLRSFAMTYASCVVGVTAFIA